MSASATPMSAHFAAHNKKHKKKKKRKKEKQKEKQKERKLQPRPFKISDDLGGTIGNAGEKTSFESQAKTSQDMGFLQTKKLKCLVDVVAVVLVNRVEKLHQRVTTCTTVNISISQYVGRVKSRNPIKKV